jgi:poly(hydroxyalkanoate) granule-associated protein
MKIVDRLERVAVDVSDELLHTGRQVWLAGLGAVGMAGNVTQAVVGMLVDEGLKLQKVEVKRLDKLVDTVSDRWLALTKLVEDNVQSTTKTALSRLGLPSRKDVSELMVRVEQLTAKVETLKASKRRMAYAR